MSQINQNIKTRFLKLRKQRSNIISILIVLVFSSTVLVTNIGNEKFENTPHGYTSLEKLREDKGDVTLEQDFSIIDDIEPSTENQEFSSNVTLLQEIVENSVSSSSTWLESARDTVYLRINAANGSLQVNTQTGSTILTNTPVEIRNNSNSIVASGLSDGSGNFTISELPVGNYTVIIQQDTNLTVVVEINDGDSKTILANFGRLQITTEDEGGSPVDATIELRDSSDSSIELTGEQTGPSGDIILIVAPILYDVNAFYGYGQSQPSIVITDGSLSNVAFVFGSIEGKFGSIVVSSHGFYDMSLSSSVTIRNYTSGAVVASGTTSSYTGIGTWVLAPDIYTVEVREMTTVVNESVVVVGNIQTNITVDFGLLLVYQDNTTETFVEVYNEANTIRLTYDWINPTTKLLALTLAQGTYNVHYSGQNYFLSIGRREKILINSQLNTAPTLLSVLASPSRINANETTNLTVSLTDINYDYDNVKFNWSPNVGTITGKDLQNRFTNEGVYSSTVTYNAPTTLKTMYIDIFVNDTYSGNFSYRIYVSNRQGTISINSTQLGGMAKSGTFIELYHVYTGVRTTYNWADASGWVSFTNILEDEYYLKATEGNIQTSSVFHFETSVTYYYQFKWGLVHVNSTGLGRVLIDTLISTYNHSTADYYSQGTTSTSGQGYFTFYLSAGTFDLRAAERNYIWWRNVTVIPHEEQFREFQFSVFAIYYLNENGDPQSTFVEFHNRSDGIRQFYDWTSSTGYVVFIVAPYNNYSITVTNGTSDPYIYQPLSIGPNEGQNVGQFINHLPVITGYSSSALNVMPSGNTTITISASDEDPLDVLTYVYNPSMGSIVGSGPVVDYFAPASDGFFYLNISVVDPHGGYDNITRSVSARTATVQVNLTDFEDKPLIGNFVELYDWTTGARTSYNWADGNGIVTFASIIESFYYLRATGSNIMTSDIFISGASQYYYNFKFGTLFINSTAGNQDLIITRVNALLNGTSIIDGYGDTILTGTGQVRLDLRPDVYDIRGDEINSLFFRNVSIQENVLTNLTFKWAEFNITSRTVMNMPLPSFWEIYNSTTSIRYYYDWAPQATGQNTIYGAPGIDYQVRIHQNNIHYLNVIGIANIIANVEGRFGVLKVTQTDSQGLPVSTTVYVRNATTDVQISALGTGADGVILFYLVNGSYRITNSTTGSEYIEITPSQMTKVQFGSVINNLPSLVSVTANSARIGPSSSTIVTVQAYDMDFDYETMNVSILLSTGTLGTYSTGWIHTDRWYYQVEYFSPAISTLFQLNITLTDGQGGSQFFMLVVSDRLGTFNLHSQGNAFQGQITNIVIFRASTGEQIFSGNTNSTGTVVATIQEDYYNIRATEHNVMWFHGVWLNGGDLIDITFLWGELTIYSTGVGGEPLSGTFVEVFDQGTSVRYTYDWTNTEGKAHFILAPGVYRIVLTESTSIIFENIVIVGGSTLALGSEMPSTNRPADIIYPEGRIGNDISWVLTDTNPGYYYVIIDGNYVINSTIWTNGTKVNISIDGLQEGDHYAMLYANDTTGYEQYDIVLITVTPYFGNPSLLAPVNQSYLHPNIQITLQNTTNVVNAWYQYQHDGVWSINESLSWSGNYWTTDLILNPGSYHLIIYIQDSYGFEIVSTRNFTILPVAITLSFPLNESITKSEIEIDVNIIGTSTYIYNWDDTDNQTLSDYGLVSFNLPSSEGLHYLTIYVLDTLNVWHKRIYTFTVDNTAPEISPFDNLSDGSEVGTGNSIPFSIIDSHFESFWYYWNNSEGRKSNVYTDTPWAEAPLTTGLWTLNVYANDTAGNLEYQEIKLSILDSAQISEIYPNGGEIEGGFVNVSWISSENLSFNLFYSPDSGFSWIQLTEGLNENFYIWDTSSDSLNGSTFLVRVVSITPGNPGELRSEYDFTLLNIITRFLPEGTTEIQIPDTDITITVSDDTNVTIQRLTEVLPIMDPNASDFTGYGLYIDITLENQDVLEILTIEFNVSEYWDIIQAQGLDLYDINVYFFNETSNEWEPADRTSRNLIFKIVIGTFDHTTTIGALGKTRGPSQGGDFGLFFVLIVLVIGSVSAGALLVYDHQLKTQAGTTSYYSQIEEMMKKLYGNVRTRFEKDG
ncbi:MAG: hypothetical protein ACXAAT_01985 [Candidatus Hodarchaeales archaeon]